MSMQIAPHAEAGDDPSSLDIVVARSLHIVCMTGDLLKSNQQNNEYNHKYSLRLSYNAYAIERDMVTK